MSCGQIYLENETKVRSLPIGAVRSTSPSRRLSFFAPIGAEPPIDAKGERPGTDTHRRVSLRWLAGTGLTGLIGAGLLGGAIYAAFDGETNFAEAPTRALLAHKEQPQDASVNPRKGDRIVRGLDMVASKQTFKTPTTIRVGDHDVVRNRAFTRVSTTLTLSDTGLGADVPDFNPLQMLADSRNPAPDTPDETDVAPTQDNPEASFTDSDLAQVSLSAQSGTLSLDEVRAQVAEMVKSAQARGNKAPLPLPPQLLLMRTSRAGLDVAGTSLGFASPGVSNSNSPFSTIEVRMVPENVTLAPKSAAPQGDAAHPAPATERLVVVRHGEDLDDILGNAGVGKEAIKAIKDTFRVNRNGDPAIEGRRVKLSFAEPLAGDGLELARVSIYENDDLKAAVAMADDGRYLLLENAPTAEKRTKSLLARMMPTNRTMIRAACVSIIRSTKQRLNRTFPGRSSTRWCELSTMTSTSSAR